MRSVHQSKGAFTLMLFMALLLSLLGGVLASTFHEYSKEQIFLLRRSGVLKDGWHNISRPPYSFYSGGETGKELEDIYSMSVGQLKNMLRDRQISCVGCVERGHLVERVVEMRHQPTMEQLVVEELILMENVPLEYELAFAVGAVGGRQDGAAELEVEEE
ncbi:uncharacterized protein TEOVI_000659200 [Trypanosoma equiperdum]|uniref:Uncharacterized protein n=1 Tax=Trypanosoma equiperdum TaxID=5694 RepID=A0A1G4I2W6_TRYEQ|nr:hypothetical protein, conserved [Trypanosoma equiperdum]